MRAVAEGLVLAGRYGRVILVVGIVAGVLLPGVAEMLAVHIGPLVTLLLFLAVLRVGPDRVPGALRGAGFTLAVLFLLQCALPFTLALVLLSFGMMDQPFALASVMILAAAPLSGGPHIVAMTGHDPAPALRQMVLGIVILPLTVVPVFWMTPELGSSLAVFAAALKLLMLIVLAGASAFLVRAFIPPRHAVRAGGIIDGISAIAMAVVVIGLMSRVGPALWGETGEFLVVLAYVFVLNFGAQIAVALILRHSGRAGLAPSMGVLAGNRNVALFLAVLPAETSARLLLFVGCYQIPIYLTAILLRGFYDTGKQQGAP